MSDVAGEQEGMECVPYDLKITPDRFKVDVSWKTELECTGYLRYSLVSQEKEGEIVTDQDGFIPESEKEVEIDGLKPQTTYYVTIFSNEKMYGDGGQPIEVSTLPL